ncbi:hypothetical protein [Halobacillus mangrovi]|uniref:Uncharacterized protein n=1 Tax=Halobacillus mangrovi TaxID=402384 RepID=A0A1W5ZXA7_9BACI|nr:hypothetical protein [Halobacillus mangrovi]ARI77932.1 hypothetical protein HM131_14210 [Halobacillus mangrovi]
MSPTIPGWLLIVCYLAFFGTFITAIRMLVKRKLVAYSVVTIVLLPVFGIINVMGAIPRPDQNELQYWVTSFFSLEGWAWISFVIFVYFSFWWYKVLRVQINGRRVQDDCARTGTDENFYCR